MTMERKVQLTPQEMMQGATIGVMRHCAAKRRNLPDRHGFKGMGWAEHIEGACGEMAFARVMGWYYSCSVNTFKNGGDVGAIQVRTRSQHDYELIVRVDDRDDDQFVLVTGRAPDFIVRGWILGAEAKRPKEWLQTYGNREPAYFVPHSALLPLELLVAHTPILEVLDAHALALDARREMAS